MGRIKGEMVTLPIYPTTLERSLTEDTYRSLYPAPERDAFKPSQVVLSNKAVGFLPVPTRLDNAVNLIDADAPQLALSAMEVDYRVRSLGDPITEELVVARDAAIAARASRFW